MLCGRVFNFLFQSFPLGDKSSVNLRGEYHSENVTTFETVPVSDHKGSDDAMEVDGGGEEERGKPAKRNSMDDDQKTEKSGARIQETIKDVKANEESDAKHEAQEIGPDQLYQTFWSLQKYYSQPTSLFDEAKLAAFKRGLEITMHKFKSVQQERTLRAPPKTTEEGTRGLKRKRTLQNEELSSAFNPKYLTSRDLFDLELSDLSFRRHILVQALILLDFVLSLTPKAKKKLEHMSNRSVLYTYTLSEEDAKWAASTRQDVANYLQEGPEGKFFYRMVATVLSRDKNWTRWKAEACPPILKPAMSISDFEDALKGAQRTFADKKLRSAPMGSLNLDFLSHTGGDESMESLKNPERYEIPSLGSFERPLADDEFDLEMARDDEEKHAAEDAKSSKLWRALRIASRTKLGVLDKVDDGKNVKVLFQTPANNAVEEKPAANEEPEKEGHLSDAKEEDLSSKIDDGGIVDSIGTPNGVQETPVDDGKVNNGNCQPQHAEEQSAESVVK